MNIILEIVVSVASYHNAKGKKEFAWLKEAL
jgi:hypothetical protein